MSEVGDWPRIDLFDSKQPRKKTLQDDLFHYWQMDPLANNFDAVTLLTIHIRAANSNSSYYSPKI